MPKRLADSSIAADVTFENVSVDADAVLGDVDGGRGGLKQSAQRCARRCLGGAPRRRRWRV